MRPLYFGICNICQAEHPVGGASKYRNHAFDAWPAAQQHNHCKTCNGGYFLSGKKCKA